MIQIRISKIVVLGICALLGGLPGINNILDYGVNLEFVRHVLSMDTLKFTPENATWRAIESPFLHHLGYISIILGELALGVLGIWGCIDMWKARKDVTAFNKAKIKGIIALTIGIAIWLFGFIVVGGEWFLVWLSDGWDAIQSAFRFVVVFMFGLLFLFMKDENWD